MAEGSARPLWRRGGAADGRCPCDDVKAEWSSSLRALAASRMKDVVQASAERLGGPMACGSWEGRWWLGDVAGVAPGSGLFVGGSVCWFEVEERRCCDMAETMSVCRGDDKLVRSFDSKQGSMASRSQVSRSMMG